MFLSAHCSDIKQQQQQKQKKPTQKTKKTSKKVCCVWKVRVEGQRALSMNARCAGGKEESKNLKLTQLRGKKRQLRRDLIDNGLDNVK